MKKAIGTAVIAVGASFLIGHSPALQDFLKRWEGNINVVYADKLAGGLPTVCTGITRHVSPYPVIVGEYWSNEKCAEVERLVTLQTQKELGKCLKGDVPQSVFDALSSHAHNFGYPRTCGSQAVQLINQGKLREGCNAIAYTPNGNPNWSRAGGSFVQGLHNRRKAERELCLKDLQQPQ